MILDPDRFGRTNPHRGCPLADDAPLWINSRGGRMTGRQYRDRFETFAKLAGLDLAEGRVTPQLMRLTGATIALESGVPLPVVMQMGRWTNVKTLLKHYLRSKMITLHEANQKAANVERLVMEQVPALFLFRARQTALYSERFGDLIVNQHGHFAFDRLGAASK